MNHALTTIAASCFALGLAGCPGDPGLDYVNCGAEVGAPKRYQSAALPQGLTLQVGDVIAHCINETCVRDSLALPAKADSPSVWPLLAKQGCSVDLSVKPSTTRCDEGVIHANATTIEVQVQAPPFASGSGSYRTTVYLERAGIAPRPLFHSTVDVVITRGVKGESCDSYVETPNIVVD